MKNEFELAFNEITELRSLPREVVLEALRTALVSAYRRDSGVLPSQQVEATVDPVTGRARIFVEKEVIDEVSNPVTEVDLESARYYNPEANLFDTVMVQVEGRATKKFGRIVAQAAKQVILQKIREAERSQLFAEFSAREGEVVSSTVQSVNGGVVTLSLGRAEAVMPRPHQIPGERYHPRDKLRVYVVEVKTGNRGPQITVSRSHRSMLKRLLEFEVPEIYNGQVEIKSIAREAGFRSKVAVAALQDGIDPVGACVGMRGMRIQNIVNELHNEKIDVIEWNPDQKVFIQKALSPARVTGVYLDDDPDTGRTASVIVPDDQLSLAIGREGQNARLAAKLTGWRIDIKSETEAVQYALDNLARHPLNALADKHATLIADVQAVLQKRQANRTVMPEEFSLLSRFANIAEARLHQVREEERLSRLQKVDAVKATIPAVLFSLPLGTLDVEQDVAAALGSLENVGEVMWRFYIDEQSIATRLRGLGDVEGAMDALTLALNNVMMAAVSGELEAPAGAGPDALVDAAQEAATVPMPPSPGQTFAPDADLDVPVELAEGDRRRPRWDREPVLGVEDVVVLDADDDVLDSDGNRKKDKKKRQTQFVFDEHTGRMVNKRKRKDNRQRGWNDFDE